MSSEFPDAWLTLQCPHVRAELLEYLKTASSADLWSNTFEVEFLVHFIFDDHDFGPEDLVTGLVVLSTEEADALSSFVAQLGKAIGPKSKKLSNLTLSDWEPVATAAKDTLEILVRLGVPRYG